MGRVCRSLARGVLDEICRSTSVCGTRDARERLVYELSPHQRVQKDREIALHRIPRPFSSQNDHV
jgi:hypothetical protein